MMIASGSSSFRLVAARYPTSLFVSSPTTPARRKSARIRSTSFGSRSSSIAAPRSGSLMSDGFFSFSAARFAFSWCSSSRINS